MSYTTTRTATWLRPILSLAFLLVIITHVAAQVATYTATSTWVAPTGVTQVTVECWGGGGKGGSRTNNGGGGGGGGGAYARSVLTVVPGTTYTVTVGAGATTTSAGGDSWFSTAATILAKGGGSVANNTLAGANGGAGSPTSIGDVVYAGGDGAAGLASRGGGGGSSAGTGAVGGDGSGATGGTAPTGGGAGGNGRSGTQGDGTDGSAPGGGGGGAYRTSNAVATRNGGDGANGKVIVSFDYTNGFCMNAVSGNAIPDAGCMSIPITISGLPTTLGAAPGNARLESVELIFTHPNTADLDITVISPIGTSRAISTDNFGTGNDYGSISSCPGTPLVFRDGATAIPGGNTNNPVGPYNPEVSLGGFTGNPNGDWVVNICDDTGTNTGNVRYIKLNFCEVPTITATSNNSPICSGSTLNLGVTATGTSPLSYAWTGLGTFSPNNTSANVNISGAFTGSYAVTVSNACGSTSQVFSATVNRAPSGVSANSSSPSVCSTANTVNLTGAGTANGLVILSEAFNGVANNWTAASTSTGGTPANSVWTLRPDNYFYDASSGTDPTFSSNDDTQFYLTNSDAQGSGNTGTTLTSPAFSTTGLTSGSIAFYHHFRQQTSNGDTAKVQVSTNGSTWTTLQTYSATQGAAAGFVAGSATLTGGFLNQPTVYVRFWYKSPWGWYWAIDNVTVTGSGAPTFGWTSTPSGYTSSTQSPTGVAVTQTTTYNLTVTAPGGCTGTANAGVTYIPSVTPSVATAITTGTNPVCAGTSVTFTATPTNGGASPTYQWTKNGTNIGGATSVTYTGTAGTAFVNGDLIRVVMTSNATCASPTTATSTAITMVVNPLLTPSVTTAITTGTNPTCAGTNITFTATPTNGGASPTYQWTRNGTNIGGATSVTYTGAAGTDFVNGDLIRVVMTTNATCPTSPTATSTAITMSVSATPTTANAGSNQATCISSGSATMAANTPGAGTGAWSQISGPVSATIATASSPTTNITGMSSLGSYVFRWTISNSPCAASTSDVTIVVDAVPTTADAGSDQDICTADGTATMAANTPVVGTGAWSQLSGPSTATFADNTDPATDITDMTAVGTYTFQWTISNGGCTASTDEVEIVSDPCAYFSRGDGDVSDAIWGVTPTGTAGLATFTSLTDMVVQNGDDITTDANTAVKDLLVETGGTLIVAGGTTISVHGTAADFDGTLTTADNSTLALVGSSATVLSTTGSPSFYDLTVDNSAGTTLSGSALIRGTLLLEDGDLDAGSGQLVLASTATYTGRLGPVGATASYTGDLTMQRYIPAGRTNWRMMGSSVTGETVNEWKDDFTTAGFPGSHVPGFSSPLGSGILWPSVRWYDETNTGSAVLNGLTGATSTAQSLAQGQGFAAWCGTGLSTTTAFTVDMTGNPIVASSPITLPMTYTNTGVPATDGWNMVSNPLPSPIAFDQLSLGADVDDYIVYFDPATGNNAIWDISSGSGLNGGTSTIQSSQGFWLKANGTDVTTTVSESAKVSGNGGGFFGDVNNVASLIRLRINSTINQFSDEALVVFSEGTPAVESDDVPKLIFAHPEAPQIATVGETGQLIAINAYGQYTADISIPVMVDVAVNGNYTITATQFSNIGLSCLRLEDLATNTTTPMADGAGYTFAALAADDATEPRFVLHGSAPLALLAQAATCAGRDDGQASVDVISGPVDIQWINADGLVLLEQNNVMEGESSIMALEAGEYGISIGSEAGCGALATTFVIDEPSAMEATAIAMPTMCPASEDGSIDLTVLGGVAPYTYLWNTNATSEDLTVAAGTYSVEIMDANGCNMAPQEYVVSAGEGPDAGIAVQSSTVMVDDAISFVPTSTENATYAWDFGDNSSSNDAEPVHTYTEPGVYTVTLTVDDGTCTNTSTLEITVESTTGLPTIVGATLNAWVSGDQFVVDHNFSNNDPVIVRILSVNGQLLQQHRFAAAPARLTLSNADLATGIYLLRISNGNSVRTFSVPVAH